MDDSGLQAPKGILVFSFWVKLSSTVAASLDCIIFLAVCELYTQELTQQHRQVLPTTP